jgi:hypothetical protein
MAAPMFPYLPPLAMSPEPTLRKEVVRTINVNDGSMVGRGWGRPTGIMNTVNQLHLPFRCIFISFPEKF